MSEQNEDLILTDDQSEKLDSILPKLTQLEQELNEENPEIDSYLKLINDNLRQFPDLVHLLSDEQIKPLYSAMRKKTDIQISVKANKKKGKAGILDDGRVVGDLL